MNNRNKNSWKDNIYYYLLILFALSTPWFPRLSVELATIYGALLVWISYNGVLQETKCLDRRRGRHSVSAIWLLLYPVYLWKRADAARTSKRIFWIYVFINIAMAGSCLYSYMYNTHLTHTEKICDSITMKLENHPEFNGAKCETVEIVDQMDSKTWIGRAALSNGQNVRLEIERNDTSGGITVKLMPYSGYTK